MKTEFSVLFICLLLSFQATGQMSLPRVTSGKIDRIEDFHSAYGFAGNIDIWLPEGYSHYQKYAVLYMHDGQMLFDPDQTWNHQAWNVDDVVNQLYPDNKLKRFIVVGIWNSGQTRHRDYFPQKPFEAMPQVEKDTVIAQLQRAGRTMETFEPQSDNYLKFITEELKPYIDRNYSVYTNRKNTYVAGSSMGGLISVYAICEYPGVFGGAACLSTHWVGTFSPDNNPVPGAFIRYLGAKLPNPEKHIIYYDCGDQTLDALYPPIQRRVDSLMKAKGYDESHWMTKYFPGEDHSEKSWNKRFNIPIEFLMRKKGFGR